MVRRPHEETGLRANVKSIQVGDEEFYSPGKGMKVDLSLRGIEPKDLDEPLARRWQFPPVRQSDNRVRESQFYRQDVVGRVLRLQPPGELLTASFSPGPTDGDIVASLPLPVPVWSGMRVAALDLNGRNLRVAGGGVCKI